MNRSTWLGRLFRKDRMQAREEFLRVIRRYGGNVKAAAIDLGFDRRYMFRILWRESLWQELDNIRAKKTRSVAMRDIGELNWLDRARVACRTPRTEEIMSYRTNTLGLQVRLDPRKAAKAIASAYKDAGSEAGAARLLKCGRSSLQRWVRVLVASGHLDAELVKAVA